MFTVDGERQNLIDWLREHAGSETAECSILLGNQQRFACRLLAMRVPEAVARQRRCRLAADAKRKGRQPSQARIEWCQWSVVVTNVPPEQLSWQEAWTLMRARWQIELLFKLWKQHGLIDESVSDKPQRRAAELFAKLIAAVLQHWVFLTSVWQLADRSLVKSVRVVRHWVRSIAEALPRVTRLR